MLGFWEERIETYASSNPEMASLMPSVLNTSVPYRNLADPLMLSSSPTEERVEQRESTHAHIVHGYHHRLG